MSAPSIRAAVQTARSAINEFKKRGGPKTPEGREKSSLNSLRHGLSAKHLLLPGEDAAEYEAHMDSWFSTLAPANLPEATLVAQLGDTAWKLERLSKLEDGLSLARLEEVLETTAEFQRFILTHRALQAVGAFVEISDVCPVPQDMAQTEALLAAVEGTMKLVREVPELPEAVIQPLAHSLGYARDTSKGRPMLPDAYRALGEVTKVLKAALSTKVAEDESALGPVRERLAAEVLLLEDADLKKLERHRKLLESSMQRQLDLLGQVRARGSTATPQAQAEARELRVKLRLVK
jgi:Sec-independent protein translocase protein TatA